MSSEPTVSILLVDDSPENLLALEAILSPLRQRLVKANSGQQALRHLLDQDFALILLDVQMPGMDGFETATLIRQRLRSGSIPIIFLTAFDTDRFQIFRGYSLGAVDYLIKPLDPDILLSKVSVFVELHQKNTAIQQQAAQLAELNAQLTASEERFRLLSACSPIGIFLTDTSGCLTYMNPRCQDLWHLSLQPGNPHMDWLRQIHPEDQSRILSQWTTALRTSQPFMGEFRFLLEPHQEAWVCLRTAPMISEHRAFLGYVGTLEDITERKQAEMQRAQLLYEQIARQEAEAANRLKDEFLMVLSHELRTPLNPILAWSQLLQTRTVSADKQLQGLAAIERNAKLQQRLIEDILDVSRIIQGKLQLTQHQVSLSAVIEQALETVRLIAEAKAIELKVTIADPDLDLQVYGDPARLQQVVGNLLTNAIKFTPQSGRVEVRLDTVEAIEPTDKAVTSAFAQVRVTDTGIGISPALLPHIFDRFLQADSSTTRRYEGLGLGLAIARHLVELHQGTIQVVSAGENQGATFTVRLPLLPQPQDGNHHQEPDLASIAPASTIALKGTHILIVDDQPDTTEALMVALEEFGAVVTTVASVDEALAEIQRQQPDLLISDIGLPDKDGYALIRQIRAFDVAKGASLPAIALTGYASNQDQQQALLAGFQRHLAKPIDPTRLAEIATSLLQQLQN